MKAEEFAELITSRQKSLYGYIYSLLGRPSSSWDVLQNTNLVLWRKKDEFKLGTNFEAWSCTVARFQAMAFLRDQKRDPLSVMTPELVDLLGEEAELEHEKFEPRMKALKECREELSEKNGEILNLFYDEDQKIESISERMHLTQHAVKQALFRIRRSLQDCINQKLKMQGEG